MFDYIERFYNPRWRHSTLGYLSPIAFEDQEALAYECVNETGSSVVGLIAMMKVELVCAPYHVDI